MALYNTLHPKSDTLEPLQILGEHAQCNETISNHLIHVQCNENALYYHWK